MPNVSHDLRAADLDFEPRNLPEIIAKIETGETMGNRGILVMGVPGCGKTARLQFISRKLGIKMKTATEIAEFALNYPDELDEFIGCGRLYDVNPPHFNDLIIDDIGTEPAEINRYGTRYDIIADVICRRYNYFPRRITHFSTNLSLRDKDGINQIEARYGQRIYSRLCEMCSFITLRGGDRRQVGMH
jgi:DNA replication protein DnaC